MAMIVALFSSCNKKMGPLSADYFTVTPQVLEAVGGKVPATINGKFPGRLHRLSGTRPKRCPLQSCISLPHALRTPYHPPYILEEQRR